jgi:hypothetical protein
MTVAPRPFDNFSNRAIRATVSVVALIEPVVSDENFGHWQADAVNDTPADHRECLLGGRGSVCAVDSLVDVEGEFQGVECAGRGDLVVGLAAQHGQHVVDHGGVLVRGR